VRIGGYEPCSFCDYEGKLAAVVFTQGCNFRCPFCHNGALMPLRGASSINVDEVLSRLSERCGKLDAVVITGGEPTLHADLADFIREVRALGFLIKLDTNGSRPETLAALIGDGLLDYIAMDVKAPWSKYAQLAGLPAPIENLQRSMHLIAASGLAHEFRTTVVAPMLSADDLREIEAIIPAGSRWKQQVFRAEKAYSAVLREQGASVLA